jgi:acyl carrier protein
MNVQIHAAQHQGLAEAFAHLAHLQQSRVHDFLWAKREGKSRLVQEFSFLPDAIPRTVVCAKLMPTILMAIKALPVHNPNRVHIRQLFPYRFCDKRPMTPALDPQTIARQLCQFARTNFVAEGKAFDEQSPLAEAGIDSFALFEMLLYGETTFGVRVPPSHLTRSNLESVATMARCMAELARNGQSSAQAPG